MLAVISGLVWGAGAAILLQQLGVRSLDPLLAYGVPVAAAVISWLWVARRTRQSAGSAALVLVALLTSTILAQDGGCVVEIDAGEGPRVLTAEAEPIEIGDMSDPIRIKVFAPGADGASATIWVEVGGIEIPIRTGTLDGVEFEREVVPEDDFAPFATPGLYHVGGDAGSCSADGYIRIGGNPLGNPIGQAATVALLVGLLGTWLAARPPTSPRRGKRHPESPGEAPEADAPEPEEPTEESPSEPAAPPPTVLPPRLEARIFDVRSPGTALSGFVAGTTHRIDLRLGAPDPALHGAVAGIGTPEPCHVVLSAPGSLATPQIVTLDQSDDDPTVSVTFTAPSDVRDIDVRLTAVTANRILHTARLPSQVATTAIAAPAGANVAVAETTALPLPTGAVQPFDAAYLVDGGHGLVVADESAAVIDFNDVAMRESVDKIRRRLNEIAQQPGDFAGLDAAGTVELLVFLAHHGKLLRDALVTDHLPGSLATARALQVASSRPDAFFPFELAYDFPAPGEDARLCSEASAALAGEAIDDGCPGHHDAQVVCPLGFWAVSRVIERHSYQPGERLPTGFVLRTSPTASRRSLSLSSDIVFAASDRVDAHDAGTLAALSEAIDRSTGSGSQRAETWEDWEETMTEAAPSIALLLPHTVHSDLLDVYGLEIGSGDRRWAGDIDRRLLPADDRPIIVALFGCETATAGVDYERFPALFRRAGAEVVLATLSEVLGRHAAPAAEELVRQLETVGGETPVPFGEVMVRLRRRLLLEGFPMILAVTAYGDADWVLTRGDR